MPQTEVLCVVRCDWEWKRCWCGMTENAGVENAARSQRLGWKMQEWNLRHDMTGMENAGVEWYGKPFKLTKLLALSKLCNYYCYFIAF